MDRLKAEEVCMCVRTFIYTYMYRICVHVFFVCVCVCGCVCVYMWMWMEEMDRLKAEEVGQQETNVWSWRRRGCGHYIIWIFNICICIFNAHTHTHTYIYLHHPHQARLREAAMYEDWERKEEEFHLEQVCTCFACFLIAVGVVYVWVDWGM
jgi:hypothetical protein